MHPSITSRFIPSAKASEPIAPRAARFLHSAACSLLLTIAPAAAPLLSQEAATQVDPVVWTNLEHRRIGEGILWAFNKGTGLICLKIANGKTTRHSLHSVSDLSEEHRKLVEAADISSLPGKEGWPREPRLFDTQLRPGMTFRDVLSELEARGFRKPSVSTRQSTAAVIQRNKAVAEGRPSPNSLRSICASRVMASKIEAAGRSNEATVEIEAHFIEDMTQTPPVPVAYKLEYRIRHKHLPREQSVEIVKSMVESAFGPPLNDRSNASWNYTDQPLRDGISDEQLAGSVRPFVNRSNVPPARSIHTSTSGVEWSDHVLLVRIAEARAEMIRKAMDSGADPVPVSLPSKKTTTGTGPAPSSVITPIPATASTTPVNEHERAWQTREGVINGRLWAWNPGSDLVVIRPSDPGKRNVRLARKELSAEDAAFVESIQPSALPAGTGAPKAFDILGIQPGMTSSEVTKILQSLRFETRISTAEDTRTCVASRVAWHSKTKLTEAQKRRLPHAIEGVRVENHGHRSECTLKISVRLMEDGTASPSESRVYSARLHKSLSPRALKEDWPAASVEFLSQVREKFGEPVCGDDDTWIYSDAYHGLSNPPTCYQERPSHNSKLEPASFDRRVEAESSGRNSYVEFLDARLLFELQSSIVSLLQAVQPAAIEPARSRL